MVARRQGGRPRNAWTPSRRRQLTRLYMLTTLDKNEIRDILRADGFHPSSSDIQKRLRELLPKDYAKQYRQFRPSTEYDMRRRFGLLRVCKQSRLARSRSNRAARPGNTLRTTMKTSEKCFEGPVSAFLNYNSTSPGKPMAPLSYSRDDSVLINSNLLLLDGSVVKSQFQGHNSMEMRPVLIHPQSTSTDTQPHTRRDQSFDNHSSSLKPDVTSTAPFDHLVSPTSRPLPHRQTGQNNRSSSYMKHASSVLSSTDSRRSSITSLRSLASSWESGDISITREYFTWTDQPPAFSFSGTEPKFSKDERGVWAELIDDSKFEPEAEPNNVDRPVPLYSDISLESRKCCNMPDVGDLNFLCQTCGFTQTHQFAVLSLGRVLRDPNLVLQVDFFDNTLLHCAVATGKMNLNGIRYLIDNGVPCKAVNTSGETFLHLIRFIPLGTSREFIDLLYLLASLDFDFRHQDNHGRTFLYALLKQQHLEIFDLYKSALSEIFMITHSDRKATNNCEHTLTQHSALDLGWQGAYFTGCFEWRDILLKPEILSIKSLHMTKSIYRTDKNGETILSAILKLETWKTEPDELRLRWLVTELLSLGAPLGGRDRNGDTPLAIAAMLGNRPVLAILLDSGANPNTRNYRGTGILSRVSLQMLRAAREENGQLYAMILSCFSLLVDSGAKTEPTQQEEWYSAEVRRGALSNVDPRDNIDSSGVQAPPVPMR